MSLPHALLTALLEQEATGFDLAKRFDRSMSYYWHATHQQIYRELAKMEQQGWIESQASSANSRIKLYHLLPDGQQELLRWAQTPTDITPLREALMIKLRAESLLDAVDLRPQMLLRRQEHVQRLAVYQQLEAQYFNHTTPNRQQRIQHLILQTGMQYEQHCITWLDHVLAVLEEVGCREDQQESI